MDLIDTLNQKALKGTGISASEALELFIEGAGSPYRVFAAASGLREQFKGKNIVLCGITNAKSGRCSEDCKFCAQSSHYPTDVPFYPLKPAKQMIAEALQAKKDGAEFFGIVTSGKSVKTKKEWTEIFKAIDGMNKLGISPCASLGMINLEPQELAAALLTDPIARLRKQFQAQGFDLRELDALDNAAVAEVQAALDAAGAAPWPDAEAAFTDVQTTGAGTWF